MPIGFRNRLAEVFSGCGIVRARIARDVQILDLDGPRDKNITRLGIPGEARKVRCRAKDVFGSMEFRLAHLCCFFWMLIFASRDMQKGTTSVYVDAKQRLDP